MILSNRAGRSSSVLPKTELARPAPNVMQVRVLVAAVYNGVGHKALPKAEVGDIITVAAGAYAQDLIACELVTAELQEPEAVELQEPESVSAPPDNESVIPPSSAPAAATFPWDFLEGAGLTNQLAQAVWEAGFKSKELILNAFTERSLSAFTEIRGIGKSRAEQLVIWAAKEDAEG
jgi:hypothetical protein